MSGPNTQPILTRVPQIGQAAISVANTGLDGTGTLGTVLTGGSDGTRVPRVLVQATGTTTAGMVRLFIDTGAVKRLIKEIPVSAIVPSGTVTAFSAEWVRSDGDPELTLPSGYMLKASTHNAESFNVLAPTAADY